MSPGGRAERVGRAGISGPSAPGRLPEPGEVAHRLVVTGAPRSNGKLLLVRCACRAQVADPSPRYYNFDWLARVGSLEEAKVAYRAHLAEAAETGTSGELGSVP